VSVCPCVCRTQRLDSPGAFPEGLDSLFLTEMDGTFYEPAEYSATFKPVCAD
jgi:hypothetical protein